MEGANLVRYQLLEFGACHITRHQADPSVNGWCCFCWAAGTVEEAQLWCSNGRIRLGYEGLRRVVATGGWREVRFLFPKRKGNVEHM
ncbi:hypothetical protein DVH24_021572 [Malus domestica]|uniref:Uncharacterized protein n=1 Tax=Malus domestica TaxID=3750 RepID=A0A498JWL5_MALDO|nr:hypothetical protein DVH24_021572 [Malus domestica]